MKTSIPATSRREWHHTAYWYKRTKKC